MKKLLSLLTAAAVLSAVSAGAAPEKKKPAAKPAPAPAPAAAEAPQPVAAATGLTADEIVQMVHLSRALRNDELKGELNKGGASVPFTVKLQENLIHFSFENPKQNINLDINEKGYRLKEVTANSNKEVAASMYGQGVRGTDLTYDDISFRYLYWPKKTLVGDEVVTGQKCYVVDLYNPQRLGNYYLVRIFVAKESGALMRMQAYNWEGKVIKSCTVTSGMKVNGATVLKTMRVISHVPGSKKTAGETIFELHKPGKGG